MDAGQAAEAVRKEHDAILNKLAPFKKIAEHLSAIAFSSIDDYMSVAEGGEIQAIAFDKIKSKKLRAIESVEENTKITESDDGSRIFKDSKIKYKLYNKLDALKYLVKLRGDEPGEKQEIEHKFGHLSDEELDNKIMQLVGALVGKSS